jgi:hypothetical protein
MPIEIPNAFDALALFAPLPAFDDRLQVLGFGAAGTGGIEYIYSYRQRAGYPSQYVVTSFEPDSAAAEPSFANAMQAIQAGFGRTLSSLPEIFGVSRQTLYNWLNGETPKEQHRVKLVQLAAAARVFSRNAFKVASPMLSRTITQGKTFIQLIADGADGAETAAKLMKVVQRGDKSRAALAAILGDRKADKPLVSDIGAPFFEEDG